MNKLIHWLENSFAPKANEIFKKPFIDGLSKGMQKLLPFILTGSLVFFYAAIVELIQTIININLPNFSTISQYSFFLLGLITAIVVPKEIAKSLNLSEQKSTISIVSVCLLILFAVQQNSKGFNLIERLGPSSILVALISGMIVVFIFNIYDRKLKIKESKTVPEFVVGWINNIIPITVSLFIGMVLTDYLEIDVYRTVELVFSPLQVFSQSLLGLVLIVFIPTLFYSLGISTWIFSAITTPIFMQGIQENIYMATLGLPAANIVTNESIYTLAIIAMGGSGATLPLNLLMLRSKVPKIKAIGKISIAPSLFNINEPIVFGTPIVFNPILMLPMWISSIVGAIIIWHTMSFGLLTIPNKLMQVSQIPAPISSFLVTNGDVRVILWYVFALIIYLLIWYPFFKVYEKNVKLESESQNE